MATPGTEERVTIVERFKQEPMSKLSTQKSGHCGEVAISRGSAECMLLRVNEKLLHTWDYTHCNLEITYKINSLSESRCVCTFS